MDFEKETDFQTWAGGVLDKLHIKWYHISSKNKFVKRGIPDLLCWYRGRSFVIELKVKGGRLSKEQKKEIAEFKEQDINAHVCYTQEEFLKVLEGELRK